jgi:hypothetical protein
VNSAPYHRRFDARHAGLILLLAAGSACADQPQPNCMVATAPFVFKLIERGDRQESAAGACEAFGPESFNAHPIVGAAPFYTRDEKGQPNYDMGSLGIQSSELGTLVENATNFEVENSAADAQLFSFGAFTSSLPDADDVCPVPQLSQAHVALTELAAVEDDPATEDVDESFPGQPAVDVTLEWSNVRVYVTPAIFGSQIQADLLDTRRTPDGATCAISYRAMGLSPAVPCQALDAEGMPLSNGDGSPMLDATLCDPEANPEKQRFTGSGISPSTRYVCDPVIAYCVLDGDTVPALR